MTLLFPFFKFLHFLQFKNNKKRERIILCLMTPSLPKPYICFFFLFLLRVSILVWQVSSCKMCSCVILLYRSCMLFSFEVYKYIVDVHFKGLRAVVQPVFCVPCCYGLSLCASRSWHLHKCVLSG